MEAVKWAVRTVLEKVKLQQWFTHAHRNHFFPPAYIMLTHPIAQKTRAFKAQRETWALYYRMKYINYKLRSINQLARESAHGSNMELTLKCRTSSSHTLLLSVQTEWKGVSGDATHSSSVLYGITLTLYVSHKGLNYAFFPLYSAVNLCPFQHRNATKWNVCTESHIWSSVCFDTSLTLIPSRFIPKATPVYYTRRY